MSIRQFLSRAKRLSTSQGFTLIEIMVAVMLLMFAMAGIVPFFLGGLSQASTVRYKSIATNVARERLEEIRRLDYREIDSPETLEDLFGTSVTQRDVTFDVSYVVEESSYDEGTLKKVTVDVGWTAPPKVSAASITTLIHQQFLGPRGSYLEVTPVSPDPLGTPFSVIANNTKARYHIAQVDWSLVYDNLNQPGMTARNVYMRLVFFDEDGQSVAVGDPDNDYRISNSYLVAEDENGDGRVDDVFFDYDFDAWSIPDGYWELRAVAYNEYDQPGNVWRLRVRIEKGAPAAPTQFLAVPQADNQTVVLTWIGGSERDRDHYVLERRAWDAVGGDWQPFWTPLSSTINPKAATYTDVGSVANQLDPWGDAGTENFYQYRIWGVDRCNPGKEGSPAVAEAQIPPATTTTTLETTTTIGPTTTTSSTSTTLGRYDVSVLNTSKTKYQIVVVDGDGQQVFTGTVKSNGKTLTVSDLLPGNYQITATADGKPTLTQSFSLPAQAGQTVLTIY